MFRVLEYFSYVFLLFAASQPPRSCKDMQKGIADGGYFLGNASPHSALMLVLSLFPLFCPAVSECVEQQGPTQVLGAPRSPLTRCTMPKGSPQALVHVGTPQLSSVALEQGSSGILCWASCCPWLPFKKLGGKLQNPKACSCHAHISLTSAAAGDISPTQEGAPVVYAKSWAVEKIIKYSEHRSRVPPSQRCDFSQRSWHEVTDAVWPPVRGLEQLSTKPPPVSTPTAGVNQKIYTLSLGHRTACTGIRQRWTWHRLESTARWLGTRIPSRAVLLLVCWHS